LSSAKRAFYLPKDTLMEILKQAGISEEELK
jgi:hypothetical protein